MSENSVEFRAASVRALRLMQAGESMIFPAEANALSAKTSKLGMKASQSRRLLVDPKTYETIPVIVLTCIEPSPVTPKRGGKK